MRHSKFSNCCSIFVLTSVLLLSFSSTAFSQGYHINGTQGTQKWVDKSDELPGMGSGTVVLIGAVVAAAIVGTVLLINSGGDENTVDNSGGVKEEEVNMEANQSDQTEDGTSISIIQNNLKIEYKEYAEQQIPLNIYFSMKRNNHQFSDNTFGIGVALNF